MRKLTVNQQKFLDVLFEEAGGDPVAAIKLAGYSPGTTTSVIVSSLKEEILKSTHEYMARSAPQAAVALISALSDPTQLGIRDKMSAAREVLDRIGIVKTEKMQVEATGGVILLPPKNPVVEDDD
jgi:hypothetical protein|tara:strand:- start:42 stop:416 length:375 start_codon:yes stop_codon:yes gene_type:complete